jgi:hypothetical protein
MIQSGNEFFLNNSSAAPTQRGFRSQSRVGDRLRTARPRLILALASIIPILVSTLGCSAGKPEEPTVAVQVVPVKKATIEQTVTAIASGFSICDPAPMAKASGSIPATAASAVMTIGLNLRRPA